MHDCIMGTSLYKCCVTGRAMGTSVYNGYITLKVLCYRECYEYIIV